MTYKLILIVASMSGFKYYEWINIALRMSSSVKSIWRYQMYFAYT